MKIIVLTPIKNESWILAHFLRITSLFADHIILVDQNSTDDSLSIAEKFEKVIIIKNNNDRYDEAERQNLLIKKARELFPEDKVLIALDADEIISADSIFSKEWDLIKKSKKGTVLKFFKPNLYLNPYEFIEDRNNFWPLGFVDDHLTAHQAKLLHSTRIPVSSQYAPLLLKEIKFLHLAYLRPNAQYSKLRFYSTLEKKTNGNPWYLRRRRYRFRTHFLNVENIEITPKEWINYPKELQVNEFNTLQDAKFGWQDQSVLLDILKYPFWYFWLDDLWYVDWEEVKNYFNIVTKKKIIPPPKVLTKLLHFFDRTLNNK